MTVDHDRNPPPLLPCGIALSVALGAFAVYGWLLTGHILPWPGVGALSASSGVYALYAALAIILQVTAAVAAMAARWARGFELVGSEAWAVRVVVAGGLWNAYSLHNAFEQSLGLDAEWFPVLMGWIVSGAVAFIEIAVYWIAETLESEVAARRRAAEATELAEARSRDRSRHNVDEVDYLALTDEALEAMIGTYTGGKRRAEMERKRRAGSARHQGLTKV